MFTTLMTQTTSQTTLTLTGAQELREYGSGDIVEPGVYRDLDTGAIVRVQESDELPVGSRVMVYRRRFQRMTEETRVQTGPGARSWEIARSQEDRVAA